MKVLDLFSAAAGGWSLGMHRAGFTTIAACEFVAWRRALYAQNNPGVRIYDDVQTLTGAQILADLGTLPDAIVGSPPCQDISSANTKGKGVDGERSGLFFEAIRLIGEIRPRWFALENSSNLRTKGADRVLSELESLGYACEAIVVGASDVGANHERKRAWIIGFDPAQVTEHAAGLGYEGRGTWRHGADGDCTPSTPQGIAGDATGDGRATGRAGRCAIATPGLSVETCGDAADASRLGCGEGAGDQQSLDAWSDRRGAEHGAGDGPQDAPDADQARQAHGCLESGLRQEEITVYGRGSRRGDDRQGAGEVGVCPAHSRDASGPRSDWSLGDLAHHLQLDDGLSARVALTRVAVGGPKGTSAAALIVEAFGDAVIPQIPEAIGRAILRTEAALEAIYGRAAA